MELTIDGRRVLITGNTFPVRNRLKEIGAKWDPDMKAWYVGLSRKADVEALILDLKISGAPTSQSETLADSTRIYGKVEYEGKPYLLLYEGHTRRGYAAKLASLDGKRLFWVDLSQTSAPHEVIKITKSYPVREYRGREEYMTWGRLQSLRARYADAKARGIQPCGKCGGIHQYEETCDYCGCARCDGARGGLCEED